jgi:hypothetical protein
MEFQLKYFERFSGNPGSRAGENAFDTIGEGLKEEGRNAKKAPGNNREFFAQDFEIQVLCEIRL